MLLKSAAKRKSRLKKPCQEPLSRLHDICFFPQPQRHHSKHLRPITLVRLSMANSAIARDAHTSTTHLTSRFGPLVIECSGPPRDHHHPAPHTRYPSHAAQPNARPSAPHHGASSTVSSGDKQQIKRFSPQTTGYATPQKLVVVVTYKDCFPRFITCKT